MSDSIPLVSSPDLDAIQARWSAAHHGQADVDGLSDADLDALTFANDMTSALFQSSSTDTGDPWLNSIRAVVAEVRARRKLHAQALEDIDALLREVDRLIAELVRSPDGEWADRSMLIMELDEMRSAAEANMRHLRFWTAENERLRAVIAAARKVDARICWDCEDPGENDDDSDGLRAMHEALAALDRRKP